MEILTEIAISAADYKTVSNGNISSGVLNINLEPQQVNPIQFDDEGNPVGAGKDVIFNVNGIFYTRQTNESGQAKLNINLPQGNYTITAEYRGCRVSNNIEVLPVLRAENLTIKYGESDQFIAYLVDGQGRPYQGQTVFFNINGVLYNRTTDYDGRGILNIKLGAAVGYYPITSSFNGCNILNRIDIIP